MAAMHLDRCLAGAQIGGDLFVEPALNDQCHHFLFARTERFVTLKQLYLLRPLRPGHTVAINGLLDRVQEILIAKWFGEEFHGPSLHGAYRHLNVAVASDEDNRKMNIRVMELARQVQATQGG